MVCGPGSRQRTVSGSLSHPVPLQLASPATNFLQALAASALKKSHAMAGMFEFVNIGPNLSLPVFVVGGRFAASGATGVEGEGRYFGRWNSSRQFDKDAAHFLNFLIFAEKMLVTQKVTKTQRSSLGFGFAPSKKRAVFRPQLLSRVTRHPKDLSVSHLALGKCDDGPWLLGAGLKLRRSTVQFSGRSERFRKTFTEKSLQDGSQLREAPT